MALTLDFMVDLIAVIMVSHKLIREFITEV